MSLQDLVSGDFCPITGHSIKKPDIISRRVYTEHRKEYDKKYKAANREKIKERIKRNKNADVTF